MRRIGLTAIAVAGCGRIGFRERADGAVDAPSVARSCDAADPDLVGCWPFDGDTLDRSSYHNDATPTQVTFAPGADGQAVVTSANTDLAIAEAASLDVTGALTIEMSINLAAYPSAEVALLFDNDREYGLAVTRIGTIRAIAVDNATSTIIDSATRIPLGEWHRVAMRFDVASHLDVIVDGALEHSSPVDGPIHTDSTTGSRIGGDAGTAQTPPVIGSFDDVRVWRVVRSLADL